MSTGYNLILEVYRQVDIALITKQRLFQTIKVIKCQVKSPKLPPPTLDSMRSALCFASSGKLLSFIKSGCKHKAKT